MQPVAGLTDMPAEQKLAELDSGFPTEWPVVSGRVVTAKAVSPTRLDFALSVAASADAVQRWYRTVLPGRAYVLAHEAASDGGAVLFTFTRAGTFYYVRIEPAGEGSSRVSATLNNGPLKQAP